jgi:hypothetical protein
MGPVAGTVTELGVACTGSDDCGGMTWVAVHVSNLPGRLGMIALPFIGSHRSRLCSPPYPPKVDRAGDAAAAGGAERALKADRRIDSGSRPSRN